MLCFSKIRIAALAVCLFIIGINRNVFAQTVSSFESFSLPPDSFYNGSDFSGGFTNGAVFFKNNFEDWGGGFTSWDGYAFSNMSDTITAGFTNQYSSYTGKGVNESEKFAVGYCYPVTRLILLNPQHPKIVRGFYVTNNTYAAISMRDGDDYSKKFGGDSGDDPDWFKLSIWGYRSGIQTDTIDFYLADYRFEDNNLDYIVKDWEWVNLESLGVVDSLEMVLTSTDNGQLGMNTPGYYCMDDFIADCIPQVTDTLSNIFFTDNNFQEIINLYQLFNDADTHDSLLTFNVINSNGFICSSWYIEDSLLYIYPNIPVKNYTCQDTLYICASSGNYQVCGTVVVNVDVTSGTKDELQNDFVNVYPNPVQNYLFVSSMQAIENIVISDVTGKICLNTNALEGGLQKLDVSFLPSGMYLIKIISENRVTSKCFVKGE